MADRGRRVNLVGQTRSRRRDREFAGLVLVGTSLAAANFYAAGALNWNCPLREVTGLLCPACGATHALLALRQGNVLLAIQSNALAVLALAVLVTGAIFWRKIRYRVSAEVTAQIACVAMLAFALVRNVPAMWFLRGA